MLFLGKINITSATARRRHDIRKAMLTFELENSSSPLLTGDATFDTDSKLLKDTRREGEEERGDRGERQQHQQGTEQDALTFSFLVVSK